MTELHELFILVPLRHTSTVPHHSALTYTSSFHTPFDSSRPSLISTPSTSQYNTFTSFSLLSHACPVLSLRVPGLICIPSNESMDEAVKQATHQSQIQPTSSDLPDFICDCIVIHWKVHWQNLIPPRSMLAQRTQPYSMVHV